MKNFLIALQFLTIIPVKVGSFDEGKMSGPVIYFPLVGLLIGMVLTGAGGLLLALKFEPLFINIALITLLICLTGGIHLDGLADTVDAFSSRKNKDEMLNIMRDPHIGTMGVLSLIIIILLKIAFLSSIRAPLKANAILLMCVLSRWALVLTMFLFPYARQQGKAEKFIQSSDLKAAVISTVIALGCTIMLLKAWGLAFIALTAALAYAIGKFVSNKIGGITGDTLGAANEIIETGVLFMICMI